MQLRVLLEEHHKLNCTIKFALIHLSLRDGRGDSVCSIDFVETYLCRKDGFKYLFFLYFISE